MSERIECACGIDQRDCEYHKPSLSVYLQVSAGQEWSDVIFWKGVPAPSTRTIVEEKIEKSANGGQRITRMYSDGSFDFFETYLEV